MKKILLGIACCTFSIGLGLIIAVMIPYVASDIKNTKLQDKYITEVNDKTENRESEFPEVNWDELLVENPKTVGWVVVPDTNINYPIVAAPKSNPQYYLNHDFHGDWHFAGVPYLDSKCETNWTSYNSIVFGHSLDNKTMFSAFKNYSSKNFFDQHRTIYLLTPEQNIKLNVVAANVVNGYTEVKRVEFSNHEHFIEYWNEQLSQSEVVAADAPTHPEKVFCFVTCSYQTNNSRTLVYAIPEVVEETTP